MLKHQNHYIFSMDMNILFGVNNNNDNNKMNNIGVVGGNGYTICSGSFDKTIRIWDIETTRQFNVFKGHEDDVNSVKYGSNELLNTILSGSDDKSVRLWDIRFGQQVQVFNGHTNEVLSVEYSPFVIKNDIGNSNVICSGSYDNTIRFWDIRSNENELYYIEDTKIKCLKFVSLKKRVNDNEQKLKSDCDVNLYYGLVYTLDCCLIYFWNFYPLRKKNFCNIFVRFNKIFWEIRTILFLLYQIVYYYVAIAQHYQYRPTIPVLHLRRFPRPCGSFIGFALFTFKDFTKFFFIGTFQRAV
ncbi:WD repeat-containing protein, partial [Reticulomyxa filosa]